LETRLSEREAPTAGPQVELRLLDGFAVAVDGAPLALPLAAQRLVAFLALQHGPVRRSYVAGSLWSDRPEKRAHACLRSALWRSNQASALVVARRTHLGLDRSVRVDAHETAALARDLLQGDPGGPVDARSLDQELLPDWHDEWLLLERERLRQLCLNALERLSALLREAGQLALAVDAALAVVMAEPLRESAHKALIEAHLEQCNRMQALRQYERLEEILDRELGLVPSPELAALLLRHGLLATAR
jgi:DNA-binding SARP family transcriptional activator